MRITDAFCPRCGAPSDAGEICSRCRIAGTEWIRTVPRVRGIVCPSCGAIREGGIWVDGSGELREAGLALIRKSVSIHPDLQERRISLVYIERSSNRAEVQVEASGLLYGIPVSAAYTIEVQWHGEQCERCSRLSGNYHEGVIQVRAEGRKPTGGEIAIAGRIAAEIEEACFQRGERLSFIVRTEETRDGLDITVGSQRIGQEISQAIVRRLGGHSTTHPKLVGEKAGRPLYRITYAVRLPRYIRGDVIRVHGKYGEVTRSDGGQVQYIDLASGQERVIREDEVGQRIGHSREAQPGVIAYIDGVTAGIVDAGTGETIEVVLPPSGEYHQGDHIRFLRDGAQVIIVGGSP